MNKLYKSNNKMLFGVCAGLAEWSGLDVSIVRLLTVIGTIMTGSVLFWLYILMAILLPRNPNQEK